MFYKLFQAGLCFALGAIAHFAVAPYNMIIVLFPALSFLYYILQRTEKKRYIFLNSWLFALGYFVFSLSWIGNALLVPGNERFMWAYPLAVAGLPILLSAFPAICLTFIAARFNCEHISGWLAFVFAFSVAEVARGFLFTGFPWNNFAYSWISVPEVAQTVSIGGLYFLSTLTFFWMSLPALMFLHKRGGLVFIIFLFGIGSLGSSYFWGWQKLETERADVTQSVQVHLIQPNILQENKWRPDLLQQHLNTLIDLSEKALKPNVTNIMIWPETASIDHLIAQPDNMQRLRQLLPEGSQNYLLSGLLRHEQDETGSVTHYNSLVVYGPGATIIGIYDKHHLVPFGEYIPFQNLIPLDPIVNFSGFGAGPGQQKISLNDTLSISPLICYEIIFPGRSLPEDVLRPTLITNITNDAWYGDSPGPRQHLVQAQFRAIETGTPVARVANTGVSAFINTKGQVVSKIEYGIQEISSSPLYLPLQNETYFAKLGHKVLVALLFLLFVIALYTRPRI